MFLFSSRKDEVLSAGGDPDRQANKVIRSRFYGRGRDKGKAKEESDLPALRASTTTAAAALSQPQTIKTSKSTSFLNQRRTRVNHDPSPLRPSQSSVQPTPSSSAAGTPKRKGTTDSVTMTLAQRLNDLAAANSEGLLNDEEYRLLRQDLFERFASNSTVPSEAPHVPVLRHPTRGQTMSESRASTTSRPSSNFVVEVGRSPSIRSKVSISSSLFGRSNHGSTSGSRDFSDASSVFSSRSSIFKFPRLAKKSSASSIRTDSADTISISSHRTGTYPSPISTTSPTSTHSGLHKLHNPPSSFPRSIASDKQYSGNVHNEFDENNLQTSEQIRREIATTEGEKRRLMDAFHGLELRTLARRQRQHHDNGSADGSSWTLAPSSDGRRGPDSDNASMRSGVTSISTSGKSNRPQLKITATTSSSSRSGSIRRKNSMSSMSSKKSTLSPPPPLPSIMSIGELGLASMSSVNLTRSTGHLPMTSVPEDGGIAADDEMEDIRRRREDVNRRYEARLEYLKAKLKGAQLHEKLMKK